MTRAAKPLPALLALASQLHNFHWAPHLFALNDSLVLPLLGTPGERSYITHAEAKIRPGKITGLINPTERYVFMPCLTDVEPLTQSRHGIWCPPRARVPILQTLPFRWRPARYQVLVDQVGAASLKDGQLEWLECFDHPASWAGLCDGSASAPPALQSESPTLASCQQAACDLLRLPYRVKLHFDHRPKDGHAVKLYFLTGDSHSGDLVLLDGKLLHLLLRRC